jgi:hypothetical protein
VVFKIVADRLSETDFLSLCILSVLCVSVVCGSLVKFTAEARSSQRWHGGWSPIPQRDADGIAGSA